MARHYDRRLTLFRNSIYATWISTWVNSNFEPEGSFLHSNQTLADSNKQIHSRMNSCERRGGENRSNRVTPLAWAPELMAVDTRKRQSHGSPVRQARRISFVLILNKDSHQAAQRGYSCFDVQSLNRRANLPIFNPFISR